MGRVAVDCNHCFREVDTKLRGCASETHHNPHAEQASSLLCSKTYRTEFPVLPGAVCLPACLPACLQWTGRVYVPLTGPTAMKEVSSMKCSFVVVCALLRMAARSARRSSPHRRQIRPQQYRRRKLPSESKLWSRCCARYGAYRAARIRYLAYQLYLPTNCNLMPLLRFW